VRGAMICYFCDEEITGMGKTVGSLRNKPIFAHIDCAKGQELVFANECDVQAKPLGVKKYDKLEANHDDDSVIDDNVIGEV